MNNCHFCGPTEAELTKEEAWPKWFSRFLRERGVQRYTATRVANNKALKEWRPFAIDTLIGGVCCRCNNETLSKLEDKDFKPLLKRTALESSVDLSIEDQAVLIAWITRFAMVADLIYAAKAAPFFTTEERKAFIDTFSPPTDAWIWLSSMQSTFPAGCSFSRPTSPTRASAPFARG